MFIFLRLIPNTSNHRRNNRIRKSSTCKKIAQFFAELIPFQTFESGCPFLGSFVGERFVIHIFNGSRNRLISKSLLAKFHRHQSAAARAKRSSVFHPRTSKLVVVGQPSLSQPFERLVA